MDIENQTKKVMLNAITNYAKEYSVEEVELQLMIKSSDNEGTPMYQVLVNNKVKKQVTFNEILNVKIDFLGREVIATPFIKGSLRKLQREHNCNFEDINILIYKRESDKSKPFLYFFEGTKAVKPIGFDYIFGDMN
tara:strand:+ start:8290 stop:8697 length:408 start_codon:yes stop_codon:yes gene_type:complete